MWPFETVFRIAFGIGLFIFWGISFAIIYHLTRFGIGVQPKRLAAIFLLGAVTLSTAAVVLFTSIDLDFFLSR